MKLRIVEDKPGGYRIEVKYLFWWRGFLDCLFPDLLSAESMFDYYIREFSHKKRVIKEVEIK